jgi:putative endopeptidase
VVCLLACAGLASSQVRPQDDLFTYANADWLAHTSIPDDRVTYSAAAVLVEEVERRVHGIILDLLAQGGHRDGSEEQQIVDLYRSVTDRALVERAGLTPVQPQLDRLSRIQDRGDVAEMAGRLSATGEGGPFEVVVLAGRSPAGSVVRVMPGGLLLPDWSYYLTPTRRFLEVRRQYATYLSRLYVVSGLAKERADADAGAVLALETKLAEAFRATAGDPYNTRARTLGDIERDYPGFDWRAWGGPQGLQHAAGLVLAKPSFFKAFAETIQQTPPDTLQAWLRGRFLTAMAPYLTDALANARFDFFGTQLTGQELPREPWKRGVSLVNESLGDAIGKRYVERFFPESGRARVQGLVDDVLAAARAGVLTASWLEPEERDVAAKRLASIEAQIAYPDDWRSYAQVRIAPDDLVGNLRRLRAFDTQYRVRRARLAGRSSEWLMTAQTVNAYYSPAQHQIALPAGVLQPPFFDPAADDAVNFGSIGAVVGHELSHALMLGGLLPKAASLRRQFGRFEALPGLRVNAELTGSETLADVVGLQLAYRAYQRRLDGFEAPVIDGLTGDQRFVLAWARLWRGLARPEYVRTSNKTSPHAPARFRANGTVGHLEAFYAAFDVRSGDRLFIEPSARLKVW